jgi:DNA-binding NtrC family response regulator
MKGEPFLNNFNLIRKGIFQRSLLYNKDHRIECNLVVKTQEMKEIVHKIEHYSSNKENILIQGEIGTGKKLIAKLIHYSGITRKHPFIQVNCSALSEIELESELFGYKKKKGNFETAGKGTLLLTEITEISPNIQAKLLRFLQDGKNDRYDGELTKIPFRGRIISATNVNMNKLVKEGKFNEELFYRLKVLFIEIPPLRRRKDAIPLLTIHFINNINKDLNKNIRKVPYEVIEKLMKYDWNGNIRELYNILYQAAVLSHNNVLAKENIMISDNMVYSDDRERSSLSLLEVEREHIKLVLDTVNNDMLKAAQILGISLESLNKISGFNY